MNSGANLGPAANRQQLWIEIDAAAYRQNLRALGRILRPGAMRMAVVKANAYGHGARIITPLAVGEGVDYLGVHSLAEAQEISDLAGKTPICLLGPTLPEDALATVGAGVEPTVSELDVARALAAAARSLGRTAAVHVKVETGTHRQGILISEIPSWCEFLRGHPELRLRGIHTHYANIEDTTDHTFARRQLVRLREAAAIFREQNAPPELVHSACSAAALTMDDTHADLVRLGIASYGLWPSRETLLSTLLSQRSGPELMPVLAWKTRVTQFKEVAAGEYVGYGCSFRATHAMRLAVLPVGYYDGYDRRLSGRGHVIVRGKRAPVIGRVCMNLTMVDVTDTPDVRLGEEAILIGQSGSETVTVDAVAGLCNTINYEIVARLGRHVPRFVRKERH